MRRVGFEPTMPVFERAKTVHVLHCAATVIGRTLHVTYLSYYFATYVQLYQTVE
jgi:hypothetical protein